MTQDYDASNITVLEWLEPVRYRPWMYIWSTDTHGLHHLCAEVIDNSVDEALAGFCKNITVIIHEDGSMSVGDDGRGIPVDLHPKTKKSTLETIFTVLHAWGKFDKGAYKISGGLHGVWASIINALSTRLEAQVHRDGKIHELNFAYGVPQGDLKVVGDTDHTGTMVRFWPDPSIFETITFTYSTVLQRVRQSAYLTPGVSFTFIDERDNKRQRFYFARGIETWIRKISSDKRAYSEVISLSAEWTSEKDGEEVYADIVFQFTNASSDNLYSYVNNIITRDGGTHVLGFKNGLLKALNEKASTMDIFDKKMGEFQLSDMLEWLCAIISIKVPEPQFQWQTKGRLWNAYVKKQIEKMVYEFAKEYFDGKDDDDATIKKVFERMTLSAKARIAAKLARETVLRKNAITWWVLPGKLVDCSIKKKDNTEMYIVEGNSAGWSAKQARDSKFQAILPLRGKILNTEDIHPQKLLANVEVKSLIMAIGAGMKENYDEEKLRYDKIIIMTDADVDGAHIRTLLLTFFFRYMKPLITGWHLYIAVSPLFSVVKWKSKKKEYIYPPMNLESWLEALGHKSMNGLDIQRYKGLGELNADQLWETTMDPEERKLLKVTVDDAMHADMLFRTLMGSDVASRRHFILTHAKDVENLDI